MFCSRLIAATIAIMTTLPALITPVSGAPAKGNSAAKGPSTTAEPPASRPRTVASQSVQTILDALRRAEKLPSERRTQQQHAAKEHLARVGTPGFPDLLVGLQDKSALVSDTCMSVLQYAPEVAVGLTIKALQDGSLKPAKLTDEASHRLQEVMAGAPERSYYAFKPLLQHKDPVMRTFAASVVFRVLPDYDYGRTPEQQEDWLPKGAPAELCALAEDPSEKLRRTAAHGIGSMGPRTPQVVATLSRHLVSDKDALMREICAVQLGVLRHHVDRAQGLQAVTALGKALRSDTSPAVRYHSAESLQFFTQCPVQAVAELRTGLKDRSPEIVEQTALAFCNFGPRAAPAVPDLIKAAKNPRSGTRLEAFAMAFAAIGRQASPAIPWLTAALNNPSADVRRNSIEALGCIGPAAKPSVKAIKDAAFKEPVLSSPATDAINRIYGRL